MTETRVRPALLDDVVQCLQQTFNLSRAVDLAELLKSSQPAYLESPKLRVDFHFDIAPDLMILDPRLGTLGIVHVLSPGEDLNQQTVMGFVDRATYVRHLLLMDRNRIEKESYSVELVMVLPADDALRRTVGDALRETAGTTEYLQGIGVNVLRARILDPSNPDDSAFTTSELRRAFPWLLFWTSKWYGSDDGKPRVTSTSDNSTPFGLSKLTLTNYRLPGTRALEVSENHNVHLIHGRNGSGKSTIVEAVEYLLTGIIKRLGATTDYDAIVRNLNAPSEAAISLTYSGGTLAGTWFVTGPAVPPPIPPGLNPASFRLDQPVMDQLARAAAPERHRVFGEAFFPETAAEYLAQSEAATAAANAFNALPASLRTVLDDSSANAPGGREAAIVGRLTAFGDTSKVFTSTDIADCLSLPWTTLQVLSRTDARLSAIVTNWDKTPPPLASLADRLKPLDDALLRLRANAEQMLTDLVTAQQALREWQSWQPLATPSDGDFSTTLNTWLERIALAELADRHYQMARTLKDARERRWELDWNEPVGLFGPETLTEDELAALKQRGEMWAAEQADYFSRVQAQTQAQSGSPEQLAGTATAPTPLSRTQELALDAVSNWLGRQRRQRGLGFSLRRAIETRRSTSFLGKATIGAPGWAEPLLAEVDALTDALRALTALTETAARSAVERLSQLTIVLEKFRRLQDANARVSQSFFTRLGAKPEEADSSLIDAINELMALFTPARFAYHDIRLVADEKPERRQLRLVLDNGRGGGSADGSDPVTDADLVFNMAELNAFTVALFLLCAPRLPNPLRMLMLDDPLQNMDELTVTYVARGLARIVRLWPPEWRLLIFFHGQSQLERFQLETPGAVYELPWLTPASSNDAAPIAASAGRVRADFQDLCSVIRELPKVTRPVDPVAR